MSRKIIVSILIGVVFLAACAAPATPTTLVPTSQPTIDSTHIAVDLGPAQRAALNALATRLNIGSDQIKLVSTEAVDWPNGCLGTQPMGVLCTQNIVSGFRIVFSANGQTYEYHTNQDGTSLVQAS